MILKGLFGFGCAGSMDKGPVYEYCLNYACHLFFLLFFF